MWKALNRLSFCLTERQNFQRNARDVNGASGLEGSNSVLDLSASKR